MNSLQGYWEKNRGISNTEIAKQYREGEKAIAHSIAKSTRLAVKVSEGTVLLGIAVNLTIALFLNGVTISKDGLAPFGLVPDAVLLLIIGAILGYWVGKLCVTQ